MQQQTQSPSSDGNQPRSPKICLPSIESCQVALRSDSTRQDSPSFGQSLQSSFRVIRGDVGEPTPFEQRTAQALHQAYVLSLDEHVIGFRVVSAPTGSGKTLGAIALMTYLYPRPTMFVTKTIKEADAVYQQLRKLVPSTDVAIYTSVHKVNPKEKDVLEQREVGVEVDQHFTMDEFRYALVGVTTQKHWKGEHERRQDLGVRLCRGARREVVIVDEDPEAERTYTCQPEDVSRLLSILADTPKSDEARSAGITEAHGATAALYEVHDRMRRIKDYARNAALVPGDDLVPAHHVHSVMSLTQDDIQRRVSLIADSPEQAEELSKVALSTVEFLKAAAHGMAFYSRDAEGAGMFFGYQMAVPPESRTIVLDGTADLNSLYSLSGRVHIVEGQTPDYSNIELFCVYPPREFEGKLKPDSLYKNKWSAEPLMKWLRTFILSVTKPGERILVYVKKDFLKFGLHKESNDGIKSNFETTIEGREVHFVNFGRGRGSNAWRDFGVYIRVGEFFQQKAALVSKVGSIKGTPFTHGELRQMSSGRSRNADYIQARNAHLIVTSKQDAARINIRNFNADGVAAPGRLYFVDCELELLERNQQRMFPGSPPLKFIYAHTASESTRRDDRAIKLRSLLLSTGQTVLTGAAIKEATGIASDAIGKAMKHPKVAPIISAKGWMKATHKDVGLPGKGYVLKLTA